MVCTRGIMAADCSSFGQFAETAREF